MRRPILIALLAAGALTGFAAGFHHLRGGSFHGHAGHVEDRIAEACLRAAERAKGAGAAERADAPAPSE